MFFIWLFICILYVKMVILSIALPLVLSVILMNYRTRGIVNIWRGVVF